MAGTVPTVARAAVDPDDPTVVIRRITVPVQGSFSYRDDFGEPRAGHTQQGNDLMVPKLRPLLAAADGTVRRIFLDNGTASQGNMLVLRDAEVRSGRSRRRSRRRRRGRWPAPGASRTRPVPGRW
jgi:hypothetical protein